MKPKKAGRPKGTANTTGWAKCTIAFRPAVLKELSRQATASGLSRSRFVANLVEERLEEMGRGAVVKQAHARSYADHSE